MERYVILNAQNQIVNHFLWDGVTPWEPPEGCTVMLEADAIEQGYEDAPPGTWP